MSQIQKYKIWNKEFNKIVGPEEYVIDAFLNVYFVEHGPEGDRLINCKNKVILLENTGFKDCKGNYIFNRDEVIDNDGSIGSIGWSESCVCVDALEQDEINGFFNKSGWAVKYDDMEKYPIMLQPDTGKLLTVIK